ncbi:hypothetical protein JCM9140_3913 [Halalkalibacter wakoensis JCM 9140]|uniref:Uncharacterized protein n=1 Tax=Halalkalibacter wakoensis JCM 9140 TaxID=1236970 RepID=W4Q6R4_9BACI|nr:hypothetical protein [Halalkalibacter wakoensis]GAE27756.1 hypothetical protein JCM9140_3913 [Halalkalibacter wakoensis JCM 9140]
MVDFVSGNEEIFIIIYCLILLWVNISYLIDYKKIQKELREISSEDEIDIKPEALSFLVFVLVFNFFRRWLLYLLAISITGSIVVIIVTSVLFIIGLYDSIFNYSLAKVKESKMQLYLVVMDTLFISVFAIYLFAF